MAKKEFKVYKEKPYMNSDKNPFGLTLKGSSKEYLLAHDTIQKMLVLNKKYTIGNRVINIKDVTKNPRMVSAIIEVEVPEMTGQAELKAYFPSTNKKKGATLELRKLSDSDYSHVENLKNTIVDILDGLISGNYIKEILKIEPKKKAVRMIKSNPKLFSCDLCNSQTKFPSTLKTHKSRIHVNKKTCVH